MVPYLWTARATGQFRCRITVKEVTVASRLFRLPTLSGPARCFQGLAHGIEVGKDGGGAGTDFRWHRCDIGHKDGGDARGGGGEDAVGAVFDGEAALGGRAEGADGAGENLGVRLAVGDFIAANERGEASPEAGVLQLGLGQPTARRRRHSERHGGGAQKIEQRDQPLLVRHGRFVQETPVAVICLAHEGVEIALGGHDSGKPGAIARLALADHRLVEAFRHAVARGLLRRPPCEERHPLGVEQRAVHVKDDGGGP